MSVLRPVMDLFHAYLGVEVLVRPGAQHMLNADYFRRIDALNYTMLHDDGQLSTGLDQADVVLIGVSRTSKTPTSIYLANRGVKTANVPIVPGVPLPAEVEHLRRPLVVGLIASPERIVQIRENRVLSLNAHHDSTAYTDRMAVSDEIAESRRLFSRQGLAGDRRDPAVDRGDGRRHPGVAQGPSPRPDRRDLRLVAPGPLILASGSKVRADLLRAAGLSFEVIGRLSSTSGRSRPSWLAAAAPEEAARLLAREKALAVSRIRPEAVVIGADQTLALGRERFTKAATLPEARLKLRALRGKIHDLHSAFALARNGAILDDFVGTARLTMRDVSDAALDALSCPRRQSILSSVGCYHLEGLGVTLFSAVEGDYFTILGLPLLDLLAALRAEGVIAS